MPGTTTRLGILALMALATCGHAQTIFFDDFNGPDFHPRWTHGNGPNGGNWTYDFQDGMFNLRTVRGNPVVPERRVPINTIVDLPGDFTVTTRIGWGLGPPLREIGIVMLSDSFLRANLFMSEFGDGTPRLWWAFGASTGSLPVVREGFATISLRRRGTTMAALLDGTVIASSVEVPTYRYDRLRIDMLGDSRGMRPLHIDFVHVVPAPSSVGLLGTFVLLAFVRRR